MEIRISGNGIMQGLCVRICKWDVLESNQQSGNQAEIIFSLLLTGGLTPNGKTSSTEFVYADKTTKVCFISNLS